MFCFSGARPLCAAAYSSIKIPRISVQQIFSLLYSLRDIRGGEKSERNASYHGRREIGPFQHTGEHKRQELPRPFFRQRADRAGSPQEGRRPRRLRRSRALAARRNSKKGSAPADVPAHGCAPRRIALRKKGRKLRYNIRRPSLQARLGKRIPPAHRGERRDFGRGRRYNFRTRGGGRGRGYSARMGARREKVRRRGPYTLQEGRK